MQKTEGKYQNEYVKISIIGSGVIGAATGICFDKFDNPVIFYDVNQNKLSTLAKQGHFVKESLYEAILESSVSFVCVPTPTVNRELDFSFLHKAIFDIAKALRKKREYHVVVIRSTVLPTYTRTKIIPLLEKYSKKTVGLDFGVCMNPEFLREDRPVEDFLSPHRIVIGEYDEKSGDPVEEIYSCFNSPIFRTDIETAEMIKYVSNCFLATKISFFNEIFLTCKNLGLDHVLVSEIASLDPRIGQYGIYGGHPFGGKCLPKDLSAFINFIKDNLKLKPELLSAVLSINEKICDYEK